MPAVRGMVEQLGCMTAFAAAAPSDLPRLPPRLYLGSGKAGGGEAAEQNCATLRNSARNMQHVIEFNHDSLRQLPRRALPGAVCVPGMREVSHDSVVCTPSRSQSDRVKRSQNCVICEGWRL